MAKAKTEGLPARRAEPGTTFEFTDTQGEAHIMKADDDGLVTPADAEEAAVLDSFGLPVARQSKED